MRITIDVDNPYTWQSIASYLKFKYYLGNGEIKESKSGYGYHLIKRGLKIKPETSMLLRSIIGDDPVRITLDSICGGKPKQVLFIEKEILDEKNILNIPFKVVKTWRKKKRFMKWLRKKSKK